MSLENSPTSSAEFGEFSKLRFKRFFSEFGDFSKLGDFLQTQGLSLEIFSKLRFKISKLIFFGKKQNLKNTHTQRLSLENSPNSRVDFGDFLQTQVQNLQTHFFEKKSKFIKYTHSEVEFGEFSKLKG